MDGAATGIVGGGPVTGLGSLERWWNHPGIAAWSFVFFGCFLLNAILLLAFVVRPGLRTISNRFVMNLTASNLLTCAVLNPLLIMDGPSVAETTLMTSASIGNVCAISEGATALVTTSSVLSVLLIAVDQYFAVVDPLRYRARVDKLKSAVLIVSVWLVSTVFGLIAFLNPSPRSLWLSCTTLNDSMLFPDIALNATAEMSRDSAFAFLGNGTARDTKDIDYEAAAPTLLKTIESIKINRSVDLPYRDNSTTIFRALAESDSVTYGLIYAVMHSVFAYLLPFAGVCWIYVSIYSAAHRNSERTRRTGSRPILASASFCEDPYGHAKPQHPQYPQQPADVFAEELRRIPKISSLSSIDEISETAHSVANHMSRGRSFSSSTDAIKLGSCPSEERSSSAVVFTVGSQLVQVSASRGQAREDEETSQDPAGLLESDESDREVSSYLVEDDSRNDSGGNQRKSVRSLYEMSAESKPSSWIAGDLSGSESENEQHYGYFDSLAIPASARVSSDYFLSPSKCETEQSRRNAESPGRNFAEKTTRRDDGEENSVATKNSSEYCTTGRDRERDANSLFPDFASNLESERSRQIETGRRRSSRSAILDGLLDRMFGKTATDNTANSSNNNVESSPCLLTPIVTITPAAANMNSESLNRVSSVRSTSGYINSLKHRISNGSLFRYREETRAARISALVIVMGLLCWSPYVLLSVIKNLPRNLNHDLPHEYDVLALSFLILAAYVSPLLFGYRSRRVKKELRKFFCFRRELSYKNNRSLMAKKVLKRRHSSTLSQLEMDHRYNIFNCVYGRGKWSKEKVQFVQVPDTALTVETCRSSFSSGASTQISSTSTEEC